jgi:hypothetical protein
MFITNMNIEIEDGRINLSETEDFQVFENLGTMDVRLDCGDIYLKPVKRLMFKKCHLKGLMRCPDTVEYIEFDAGSIFLIDEIRGDNIGKIKIKRKCRIKQKFKSARNEVNHKLILNCPKFKDLLINMTFDVLTIVLSGIEANEVDIWAPNCKRIEIVHLSCSSTVNFSSHKNIGIFQDRIHMDGLVIKDNPNGGHDLYFEGIDKLFISNKLIDNLIKSGVIIKSININNCIDVCIANSLSCYSLFCSRIEFGSEFKSLYISNVTNLIMRADVNKLHELMLTDIVCMYINIDFLRNCSLRILTIKRVHMHIINSYNFDKDLYIESDDIVYIKMEEVRFDYLSYFKLINIDGLFNSVLFYNSNNDIISHICLKITSSCKNNNDAKVSLIDNIGFNQLDITNFGVLRFDCVGSILKMNFRCMKKLYLDGDFTNIDLKIDRVEYVNNLKSAIKKLSMQNSYFQLSVNDDYLYGLLLRELKITKKIFYVFMEWFKSQEFTDVYQLFDIIIGYFKGNEVLSESIAFKDSIISHLIVGKSFSSISALSLEYNSSISLLKMLFDVNLFSNLVSLNISLSYYGKNPCINASALNDIFSNSLRTCEISCLSNIQGLRCSFPELSLKIHIRGPFDLTYISRHLLCSLVIYGSKFVNIFNCLKVSMGSMGCYYDCEHYKRCDFLEKKVDAIFSDSKYAKKNCKLFFKDYRRYELI